MTMVLVDGDLIAYRVSATVPEGEPFELVEQRVDNLMQQIIDQTNANEFHAVLSGKNNFRKKINPEYKANRKDTVPPFYLQQARQYLVENWNAEISEGCEADDLLGIYQKDDTIIASLDKDLLMIPGKHFSWEIRGRNGEKEWVREASFTTTTYMDGIRKLYIQALVGDKSDNITGVQGIGPVKANKIIDPLDDEQDMFDTVRSMYGDDERLVMNLCCLYIMQNKDEPWSKVVLNQKQNLISNDQSLHDVITRFDSMISS